MEMESKSTSIFRSWIDVLTQPGEEIFEQKRHDSNATLSTAMMWILVVGLISGIVQTLSLALFGATQFSNAAEQFDAMGVPPEQQVLIQSMVEFFFSPAGMIVSFILAIVFTLLLFLLGAGLTHLIAKIFGGQGTFGRTAYLQSLFVAPMGIISSVVGLVPIVGGCIGFILFIYQIVLWFFSTKAEHNLTTGKTIGVAIVAGIAFLAFFGCIGGVVGIMAAGTMGAMPQ